MHTRIRRAWCVFWLFSFLLLLRDRSYCFGQKTHASVARAPAVVFLLVPFFYFHINIFFHRFPSSSSSLGNARLRRLLLFACTRWKRCTPFGDNVIRYVRTGNRGNYGGGGGGYHQAAYRVRHHLHECLPPTTRPAAGADVARSVCTRSAETRALTDEILRRAVDSSSNSTPIAHCTHQFRSGADHVQSRSVLSSSLLPTRWSCVVINYYLAWAERVYLPTYARAHRPFTFHNYDYYYNFAHAYRRPTVIVILYKYLSSITIIF